MWIKILLCIIIVLIAYLITLLIYFSKQKGKLKDSEDFIKTIKNQKALKTVIIKAVKINRNDLPIITNRYIFEDKINDGGPENKNEQPIDELPELEIEITINDESIITELENNDTLDDIEKMADLLNKMSLNNTKVDTDNKKSTNNSDYSDYKDFDDSLIEEYLKTNFINYK